MVSKDVATCYPFVKQAVGDEVRGNWQLDWRWTSPNFNHQDFVNWLITEHKSLIDRRRYICPWNYDYIEA